MRTAGSRLHTSGCPLRCARGCYLPGVGGRGPGAGCCYSSGSVAVAPAPAGESREDWALPSSVNPFAGPLVPQVPADTAGASVYGTVAGVFRGRTTVLATPCWSLRLQPGRRWVQADEDGSYLLDGLAPGVVTLRVRHPGYEAIAVEVTLAADAAVRVDLELAGRPLRLDPVEVRGRPAAR